MSNVSQHASLQPFPSNSTRKFKSSPFLHIFCIFACLAHFGLPGYAPGTIAVNVTWIKRGFNACQTPRSMYPSIFKRFPVIQTVILIVRHFSTFFLHILASPGYATGTIAVNVTWIEREFNAGQTPRSMYPCSQSHMAVKIDNVNCGLRLFYFKFCTVPLQQFSVTASL